MGKGTIKTKAMTMAVAMSMVAGLCPSTVFAANSEDVAKVQDGMYTGTAKCTPDAAAGFDEYNLSLSVTIKDGKIESITDIVGDGNKKNKSYIEDAAEGVVPKIVAINGTDGIDAVSEATCSSKAIVNAVNNALENATKKEEKTVDTTALSNAIASAEARKEADYTAESWKNMQDKLTAAKEALAAKESQDAVDQAAKALTDAVGALVEKTPEVQKEVYVLMNIPYADFYKADGVAGADTVSSATKQKTRASLAAGSYHVNSDGSDITGVTFPVKISDVSALEKYTQIKDDSKVDITTSIKGKESTTTYTGKEALFESTSYSYYILSDVPSYYKEATVNADGSFSFGEVKGAKTQKLSDVSTEFSTSSRYGDYQLDIDGLPSEINTVYGVVISTKEGSSYGLRHVENIWKKTELAWSTGFVTESHGNTLDSKDYAAMMGQTINKVTYYTDQGIYEIPMDQKVAKKFDGEVSVEDVSVKSEKTAITVSGLPNDFEEEYKIDGIDEDAYSVEVKSDGKTTTRTINFKKALTKRRYTVTLSDRSGNYAPISTTFNAYTETMPAKYNENDKDPAVVKADGVDEEEFQTYLKNITSVTVNGKEYAASGKKAVKLITEDGKLDLSQDAFKDAKAGEAFAVTIAEDGYQAYTFTYKVPEEDSEYSYVLMNIPYAAFYKAETTGNDTKVDAFTSATKNKTRTKGLAGGSYHENADGSSIDGITYAVKVDPSVDLSKYKKVEDSDTVDITVTNRGQTSTTTLTGKETLFENASYAYYPLSEIPANYKEVSLDADGNLVFSEVKGQEAKVVEGVTAELSTKSSYGDYELDLDGLPEEISSDSVNAVVVKTTDGTAYGMRHLENIWRGTELAWCTGFTESVHNCPTSSKHYKSMMGKTIDSIEYYTTNGLYTMDIEDIYVPVKADNTVVEVVDADILDGETTINVQLPEGFDPEYSVAGLDVSVEGKVLTFKAATESRAAASVKPGKYTLTIKDKNKKYADVVTTFTLTTKDMPAAYDEENKKLVEAEEFDTDALKAYLGNITSVNVNGKDYAASGRGSVVIINKDGTIKTDADPFKDAVAGTEFQITVASTGYTTPLTFTYKIAETPAPAEVDTTALEAAIAEADNLKEADYTADSWSVYQAALQSARTALEAKESQDAVDQALAALNAAKDALVKAEEEPVAINTASLEKAIADAKALKEADYTAESWKALQSALSDARKALEAKESQEAVDNATNSLNKAIKALVKKGSSSVKKTDGTTNGSKTSGSDSVKTGDPASVLGWLELAVSSLGAGMGGFAWKRRKRK
ncbi:hemoblobin-interacting domain-containing protein [Coprococcus comes]|uniref:hemoblobin-interacting domain-containing protein n=1 Tax=Coprococcus comes TaxID=410072 RepID=UPI0032BFDF27